jgi:hypothetical protein
MSTRLLQLKNGDTRRVALVQEPHLRLLAEVSSVYQLANIAVAAGVKLSETARQRATQERLDYDPILPRTGAYCRPLIIWRNPRVAWFRALDSLTWGALATDRQCMRIPPTQKNFRNSPTA